ncbi:hypothetical protein [Marmoricola sp. URHB0036]|uniref:hypothetical protein n=1 Tax=Marmoricola sp. URHB0036 TaxID=1298863 RepID=UPI000411A0E6|nr:hypothetical protein [Marmoricola sp. URHB0036]
MISTVRQAFLSSDLDEHQLEALLTCASPGCALAALGTVVAEVVTRIAGDRRIVRVWLSNPEGRAA